MDEEELVAAVVVVEEERKDVEEMFGMERKGRSSTSSMVCEEV